MKYKVGDKVRIKSKEYITSNLKRAGIVESMLNYANKDAVIVSVDTNNGEGYRIDIDDKAWWWFEDLLEDSLSYNTQKSIMAEEMIKDIAEVIKKHNLGVCVSENGGKLIIEPLKVEKEENLPIDTPVLCSDIPIGLNSFKIRFYAGRSKTFEDGLNSKSFNAAKVGWKYIIPWGKFNPNNIEESLKYNIVK